MIGYFRELGDRLEKKWLEKHYDEEIFPDLSMEVLSADPPCENAGPKDILDWTFQSCLEVRQVDQPRLFGEPPIILYQAPRFYIEALFWFSGTTDIHEHSFSGAFTVLSGSSVHSHWRFDEEGAVNYRMRYGRLERVTSEILQPGGIRCIRSGDQLIHQLFHLEEPSVTVVVRTYREKHRLPQYKYLLPGLAIDGEDIVSLNLRRLRFIDAMARGQMDGLEHYVGSLIDQGDLEMLYRVFGLLTRRGIEADRLKALYEKARQRHGSIILLFREVCEGERRGRIVVSRRSKVTDKEARFLLALLMLMPDREAVFETIRMRYPGLDPLDAIESWVERMSGKEIIGFELNDVNRLIFRGLVEGLGDEGLMRRLKAEFRRESLAEHEGRVLEHARQIADSDLFRPLFLHSPLRERARVA